MSEHSLSASETVALQAGAAEEHPVPDALVADRRTLWGSFGKMLLGNVVAIAVVLILMAIFLL